MASSYQDHRSRRRALQLAEKSGLPPILRPTQREDRKDSKRSSSSKAQLDPLLDQQQPQQSHPQAPIAHQSTTLRRTSSTSQRDSQQAQQLYSAVGYGVQHGIPSSAQYGISYYNNNNNTQHSLYNPPSHIQQRNQSRGYNRRGSSSVGLSTLPTNLPPLSPQKRKQPQPIDPILAQLEHNNFYRLESTELNSALNSTLNSTNGLHSNHLHSTNDYKHSRKHQTKQQRTASGQAHHYNGHYNGNNGIIHGSSRKSNRRSSSNDNNNNPNKTSPGIIPLPPVQRKYDKPLRRKSSAIGNSINNPVGLQTAIHLSAASHQIPQIDLRYFTPQSKPKPPPRPPVFDPLTLPPPAPNANNGDQLDHNTPDNDLSHDLSTVPRQIPPRVPPSEMVIVQTYCSDHCIDYPRDGDDSGEEERIIKARNDRPMGLLFPTTINLFDPIVAANAIRDQDTGLPTTFLKQYRKITLENENSFADNDDPFSPIPLPIIPNNVLLYNNRDTLIDLWADRETDDRQGSNHQPIVKSQGAFFTAPTLTMSTTLSNEHYSSQPRIITMNPSDYPAYTKHYPPIPLPAMLPQPPSPPTSKSTQQHLQPQTTPHSYRSKHFNRMSDDSFDHNSDLYETPFANNQRDLMETPPRPNSDSNANSRPDVPDLSHLTREERVGHVLISLVPKNSQGQVVKFQKSQPVSVNVNQDDVNNSVSQNITLESPPNTQPPKIDESCSDQGHTPTSNQTSPNETSARNQPSTSETNNTGPDQQQKDQENPPNTEDEKPITLINLSKTLTLYSSKPDPYLPSHYLVPLSISFPPNPQSQSSSTQSNSMAPGANHDNDGGNHSSMIDIIESTNLNNSEQSGSSPCVNLTSALDHNDDGTMDINTPSKSSGKGDLVIEYAKKALLENVLQPSQKQYPLPPPIKHLHTRPNSSHTNDSQYQDESQPQEAQPRGRIAKNNKKKMTIRLKGYITLFIAQSNPLFKSRYFQPAYRYFQSSPQLAYYRKESQLRELTQYEHHEVCLQSAIKVLMHDNNGLVEDVIAQTILNSFPQ